MLLLIKLADGGDQFGGEVVVFAEEAADGFVVVVCHFMDILDPGQGVELDVVVHAGYWNVDGSGELAQGEGFLCWFSGFVALAGVVFAVAY